MGDSMRYIKPDQTQLTIVFQKFLHLRLDFLFEAKRKILLFPRPQNALHTRLWKTVHPQNRIYPKKTGKKTAQASFEKALNSGASASVIIKALQKVVDLRWSKYPEEEKRYIPNPTTWLNQERWNDEVDSYVQKKKNKKYVKKTPNYLKKNKTVNLEDLPF